jgi:hypothetical protein
VTNLGHRKAAALPAFHALSGADNTGSFAGKGKASCWKIFQDASEDIINALVNLGTEEKPSEETLAGIEKFVCQLYMPKTKMSKVKDVRWWLFKKRQAQSERLPPTEDALHHAILRSHYQMMVWNNDKVANPELPSPGDYGWNMINNEWVAVMATEKPAPETVLHLIKCGCTKTRCSTLQCKCKNAGLYCTDLCMCCEQDGDECENSDQGRILESEDDDEEENADDEDEGY